MKFRRVMSVILAFSVILSMNEFTAYAAGMSLSENGLQFLKEREGFQPNQYWDAKQWSIGYGSKTYDGEFPNGITETQATQLLKTQVLGYIDSVNKFITSNKITLNQNQFDALVSFTYNLGANVWNQKSTLRTYLLNGVENYSEAEIRDAFGRWKYSGTVVSQGLIKRREMEATLFLSGTTVSTHTVDNSYPTPITCYPIITSGKVTLYKSTHEAYPLNSRNIDYYDQCTIEEIYTDGCCKVSYPSSASATGFNSAYAKLSDFISVNTTPYSWSPSSTLNVYKRSDLLDSFGSVWMTDISKVVHVRANLLQIIYPLDGGGYKCGWITTNSEVIQPPKPTPIPSPLVEGIFDGKSIVVMASKKITNDNFSSNEYISAGDICIIHSIDSTTGLCSVTYPSGGTDVFKTGQATKTKSVAITEFLGYQPEFKLQKVIAQDNITVYPTSVMDSSGTNWSIDINDEYYTVGRGDNGATEVLYYCSKGRHAGYWKLGWASLDYYSLNLDGYIDGIVKENISGCGRADIYVNGNKLMTNAIDFSDSEGTFPAGSSYEIKNICSDEGYSYDGVYSGSITGTLLSNTSVRLTFTKAPVYCTDIVVQSKPEKTVYLEGEALDLTGLSVIATYNDGSTRDVTSDCAFSGYDSIPGVKTIDINYVGVVASFTVTVKNKSLIGLEIVSLPSKTTYSTQELFTSDGLKVKAIYDNKTSGLIDDYNVCVEEDVTATVGVKEVLVLYSFNGVDATASFEITVEERELLFKAGDINGDGEVNNKDLTRLFQHLSDWDVSVTDAVLDVNGDGSVDNKDLIRLFQYLSDWDVEIFGGTVGVDKPVTESFVYGESERGRDLVCYSITPQHYEKTILLEFEIHGFEDEYERDGQVLVDTAYQLIDYYSKVEDLNETRLLIIPSSNPDGLLDGSTNNGFGRCNAKGIDLNRDFDANYIANATAGRNYTPYAFSGRESKALRDLCLEYTPDIVIDFHGWESSLIGDLELKAPFHEELGLRISHSFTSSNANGYFSNWAHQQGALAMLVEFTSSTSIDMTKLTNAINRLIHDEYDNGKVTGDYSILEGKRTVFMCPQLITLDNAHYISSGDICYISEMDAETGICTVVYPSGGTNVFTTGQATLSAEIKLSYILGYSSQYIVEKKTVESGNITVYPTSSLTSNGTNWYMEQGDIYYMLKETDTAIAILYYCASGLHSGFWKIGWIQK